MGEKHALGKRKVLIIVLSLVLLIIGIWFGFNCFDENGKVKELSVLLASCCIAYSLKNLYALKK